MRITIFLFFVSLSCAALGQNVKKSISIHGTVIDSLTSEPIPFVSIFKSRDKNGTISDFNGEFSLTRVLSNDTIVLTCFGYEMKIFVAAEYRHTDTLFLNREAQMLDEVVALADKSILFNLVSKVKTTQGKSEEIAKTYFELESFHNDKQLELFQGYYNGTYKGYHVHDLQMKTGRFALAPLAKRMFASTESSKAVYLHSLFETNDFFPASPLELSKRKLRKHYVLNLDAKYTDNQSNTMYVIRFEPKIEGSDFFAGKMWIDSLSNQLFKIQLHSTGLTKHPFRPIWPDHKLDTVNMEITKTYERTKSGIHLKTVHFNYDLNYWSEADSSISISTQAVLHAYNFDDFFVLPFFDFPEVSNADYRRIQMLPYNEAFWECNNDFQVINNDIKTSFIRDTSTFSSFIVLKTDSVFQKNFFEHPYVSWNGNRILIKGVSSDSAKTLDLNGTIHVNRYHLSVQLFVDVNSVCDSIQVITKTIFDPYKSYYHFETTPKSQAFINIYFDLMEIERRKLKQALEKVKGDSRTIEQAYRAAVEQSNRMSTSYFKEVQRGQNITELKKWNDIVVNELGIDNLMLFGIVE